MPRYNIDLAALTAFFVIALEGECDPRREPERGARLDTLLDGMSDEQLNAVCLACYQLEAASVVAQIRNYGHIKAKATPR